MPYVSEQIKQELEPHIAALVDHLDHEAIKAGEYEKTIAGILNYTCTTLALRLIPEKRYWAIALFSGVFRNIADEFYRRYAAPYEDQQIIKNGDVY